MEGYFCVVSYVGGGADIKGMPRFVKIFVTAEGESSKGKTLYSERVTEFAVQLTSEIKVESKYWEGVHLDLRHRTASIRVFSSNDFKVDLDYDVPEETQLVNHHVTRAD